MLLKLTNPLLVSKIVALASVVPGTPMAALERLILEGINDPDTAIFIDEKDGEVNGFMVSSKETWEGKPVCFLQFAVVRPDKGEKYVCFELLTKTRLWAKEKGLDTIITVVRRDPRAFERKYGFTQDGVVLKRSVIV